MAQTAWPDCRPMGSIPTALDSWLDPACTFASNALTSSLPACCYRPVPSPIHRHPDRGNTALPGGPPRKYCLGEASAELRRQSSDGPGTVVESANIGSGAVPTRTWCIWSPASSMAPAGRQRFRPTCGNRRDSPHLAGRIFKRRLASNRTSSETLHSCRVAPRNLRKIAA